jgi:hypothetical protein
MGNNRPWSDVMVENVIGIIGHEFPSILVDLDLLKVYESMGLKLIKFTLSVNPLMEDNSLLSLSIGLALDLRVNLTSHDLHVVLADVIDVVLLERPLDVLVDTLKELTLASEEILRNLGEDKLVVKVSPWDLGLAGVFEVESGDVESHVKRSLESLDHEKLGAHSDADLVWLELV